MKKARCRASTTISSDVFGVQRRSVASYEAHVRRKLDKRLGFIDLFWPGVLIVEQKSAGRDLGRAYDQAGEYFDALLERDRPRYILVSDFQSFVLHDLDERTISAFPLADLPDHVEEFGFIRRRAAPGLSRPRTRPISRPPNWSGSCTTRSIRPATEATTWSASWRGPSFACSPTTPASSSSGMFSSTSSKRARARTASISGRGSRRRSKC